MPGDDGPFLQQVLDLSNQCLQVRRERRLWLQGGLWLSWDSIVGRPKNNVAVVLEASLQVDLALISVLDIGVLLESECNQYNSR